MKKKRPDKRTTVSLDKLVWKWANQMMRAKGYNENFSAYVADLIRRDKEKRDREKQEKKAKTIRSPFLPQNPNAWN